MELVFYSPGKDPKKDALITEWWEAQCQIPFNVKLLSDFGYIAKEGEKSLAALFLYRVKNCEVCWIGWPIANKTTTRKERSFALDELFDKIHLEAKSMGYSLIWTTSGIPALQERLTNKGYVLGDENINQYWKELN